MLTQKPDLILNLVKDYLEHEGFHSTLQAIQKQNSASSAQRVHIRNHVEAKIDLDLGML